MRESPALTCISVSGSLRSVRKTTDLQENPRRVGREERIEERGEIRRSDEREEKNIKRVGGDTEKERERERERESERERERKREKREREREREGERERERETEREA